jgi:hypothetical protein
VPDTYRILLTTSLRSGRRDGDRGEEVAGSVIVGELSVADEVFRAVHQAEVPRSPHRPGRSSARGVAPWAGGYAVANTSQVFVYDSELRRIEHVHSEPRFGDLHSLVVRDGVLYVTATASDSVLGFDAGWNRVFDWWAGREPALRELMEVPTPPELLDDHDFRGRGPHGNQFHVNHLFFDPAGDLLANLPYLDVEPGLSKVWNITRRRFQYPRTSEVNPIEGRVHDGVVLDGHHYFAWTEHGEFVKLATASGEIVRRVDCSVPLGRTTGSPLAARHGWLRGSVRLRDELFLVGQSRLHLFLVDMATGTRTGPLRVTGVHGELDHPGLATYCIALLPGEE